MKSKQKNKRILFLGLAIQIFLLAPACIARAAQTVEAKPVSVRPSGFSQTPTGDDGETLRNYREYSRRLQQIEWENDIGANGFFVIDSQKFPITMKSFGEVIFIPALDRKYHRLAVFLSREDGKIVYKTDRLEMNYVNQGAMEQPNESLASVAFQDLNRDGLMDIVLITNCKNKTGSYAGKPYKVGEALFQEETGFYRDYRISEKINRFNMNKNAEFITSFVRDGQSTEFLYTSSTLDELLENGFEIIAEQCYWRRFEKLGKLQVVPGTISIADYDVFMIYLVNEQGYIVWSLQPMGDYDNLYALKGITCRDIDGDGMKDIVVLARYSYEGAENELVVESDYSVYYQRTGGFYADTEFKRSYRLKDTDTMSELVEKARSYWGWKAGE